MFHLPWLRTPSSYQYHGHWWYSGGSQYLHPHHGFTINNVLWLPTHPAKDEISSLCISFILLHPSSISIGHWCILWWITIPTSSWFYYTMCTMYYQSTRLKLWNVHALCISFILLHPGAYDISLYEKFNPLIWTYNM